MVGAAIAGGAAQNKSLPIVAGVVVLGVAALAYFGVARPIMCRTGIISCRRDRREDDNIKKLEDKLIKSPQFATDYWTKTSVTIDANAAMIYADELEDELTSWTGQDEEVIYGTLRSIGGARNMSYVADYYQIRHGESLAEKLIDKLSSREIETVANILNIR